MFRIARKGTNPDLIKYLSKISKYDPPHKYSKLVSIYLESHYMNICKNTPSKIESEIKKFFPEMIIFFKEIHERFDKRN